MRLFLFAFLFACSATSYGDMMGPSEFPADRIIKNLETRIAKNPKDGMAEYMLGRTYYSLYCARDPRSIRLYGTVESPRFPSVHTSPWEFKNLTPKEDDSVSLSNAKKGITHLTKAIKLGGGEPGLFQLTLACAYEASSHSASKIAPGSKTFTKLAVSAYEASFKESRSIDVKRPFQKMAGTYESWISTEACDGILRLDPNSRLSGEIAKHREAMRKLPTGPITPLIFSLEKSNSLDDLLDPTKVVSFDLDGTGAPQNYAWVKPETAFLVWQPDQKLAIRSGRQLFGSATWWLMPQNAYDAMALLDDNADGWLRGREIKDLAIWRDLNQNGISEAHEVVSIESVGIVGLKTSFSGRTGESYVCISGLKLADGRLLPTYDWVTRAKRSPKSL